MFSRKSWTRTYERFVCSLFPVPLRNTNNIWNMAQGAQSHLLRNQSTSQVVTTEREGKLYAPNLGIMLQLFTSTIFNFMLRDGKRGIRHGFGSRPIGRWEWSVASQDLHRWSTFSKLDQFRWKWRFALWMQFIIAPYEGDYGTFVRHVVRWRSKIVARHWFSHRKRRVVSSSFGDGITNSGVLVAGMMHMGTGWGIFGAWEMRNECKARRLVLVRRMSSSYAPNMITYLVPPIVGWLNNCSSEFFNERKGWNAKGRWLLKMLNLK